MPQRTFVRDIMSSPPITVGQDTPAPEVAKLMRDKDIGAVIVTDPGGRMVGIITESDFTGMGRCVPFSLDLAPVIFGMRAANLEELRRIYAMARELTARQIMHDQVATVRESESIGRAAQLMMNQGHKHLPVVRDGKPVGMLARHDMLKLLQYAP